EPGADGRPIASPGGDMSKESEEVRSATFESGPAARIGRRNFLGTLAGGVAIAGAPNVITRRAYAQAPRTIRFSEAVHNLGYIDLYVARAKGMFKEQNIDLQLSAAGGDTQAFAAVLSKSAEFGCGDSTLAQISREKGGTGVVLGELVSR